MSRELYSLRVDAEDALREYAEALCAWNAPDDEHTRIQIRALVDDVLTGALPVAADGTKETP